MWQAGGTRTVNVTALALLACVVSLHWYFYGSVQRQLYSDETLSLGIQAFSAAYGLPVFWITCWSIYKIRNSIDYITTITIAAIFLIEIMTGLIFTILTLPLIGYTTYVFYSIKYTFGITLSVVMLIIAGYCLTLKSVLVFEPFVIMTSVATLLVFGFFHIFSRIGHESRKALMDEWRQSPIGARAICQDAREHSNP